VVGNARHHRPESGSSRSRKEACVRHCFADVGGLGTSLATLSASRKWRRRLQGSHEPKLKEVTGQAGEPQQTAPALPRHRERLRLPITFAARSSALRKVHLKIPFLANWPALFCMSCASGRSWGSQRHSRAPVTGYGVRRGGQFLQWPRLSTIMDGC
jgi:hypothetical protein